MFPMGMQWILGGGELNYYANQWAQEPWLPHMD
jgi:hypothetical protein